MKIEIDDKDIEQLLIALLKKHTTEWNLFIKQNAEETKKP